MHNSSARPGFNNRSRDGYLHRLFVGLAVIVLSLFTAAHTWTNAPIASQAASLFPYESNRLTADKILQVTSNSTDENYPLVNLTDGNISTGWHSNFYVPASPYILEVQFTQTVTLDRIGYVPFLDPFHEDAWLTYQLYVAYALDGLFFPYESGTLSSDSSHKLIRFDAVTIRKMQIVISRTTSGFASAAELVFFAVDTVQNSVMGLFQSTDFSVLKPSVTNVQVAQLRSSLSGHPQAVYLGSLLDRAEALLTNPFIYQSRIYTPQQRGNPTNEAQLKQLVEPIPYYQPTGLYAVPGETITIHVGGTARIVMPSICFSGSSTTCSTLQVGTNTLIVPEGALGPIYLQNPYDNATQPIVPTLAIEGGIVFPTFKKGDVASIYRDQLAAYVANPLSRLESTIGGVLPNGHYLDVTEISGDYFTVSIPASIAHSTFNGAASLTNFITQMDEWMLHYHRFLGLNLSADPLHRVISSPVFFKAGGASLRAHQGLIELGNDDGQIESLLRFDTTALTWELLTTVGELFKMKGWVDVYNNAENLPALMALYVQDTYFDKTRLAEQQAYESLYTHLFVHPAIRNYTKLNQLAAQWQLYIAFGISPFQYVAQQLRKLGLPANGDALAMQSHIALLFARGSTCDLTTYYRSVGYELSSTVYREIDALPPCGTNINLIDERVQDYQGIGLPVNHLSSIAKIEKHSLFYRIHITVDPLTQNDILGFYIYRDGEAIAFTTSYVFDDYTASTARTHSYQIRPIDLIGQSLESSKTPLLRVEETTVDFTMTSICGQQLCGTTNYGVMFDNNTASAWETAPYSGVKNLIFEFGYTKSIYGFTYTPSQDDFVGKIDRYVIYVSQDGVNWGSPIYSGDLIYTRGVNTPVGVYFMTGYQGRYLRIAIETDHESRMIGISELQIITINTAGTVAFIVIVFILIGIIPYFYLRFAHIGDNSVIYRWLSGGTLLTSSSKMVKGGKVK